VRHNLGMLRFAEGGKKKKGQVCASWWWWRAAVECASNIATQGSTRPPALVRLPAVDGVCILYLPKAKKTNSFLHSGDAGTGASVKLLERRASIRCVAGLIDALKRVDAHHHNVQSLQ